jgi:hypothetical protein
MKIMLMMAQMGATIISCSVRHLKAEAVARLPLHKTTERPPLHKTTERLPLHEAARVLRTLHV